jgi:hypothetical protein
VSTDSWGTRFCSARAGSCCSRAPRMVRILQAISAHHPLTSCLSLYHLSPCISSGLSILPISPLCSIEIATTSRSPSRHEKEHIRTASIKILLQPPAGRPPRACTSQKAPTVSALCTAAASFCQGGYTRVQTDQSRWVRSMRCSRAGRCALLRSSVARAARGWYQLLPMEERAIWLRASTDRTRFITQTDGRRQHDAA